MRKNNIIIAACLLVAVLAVTGCWAITKGHSEADPTPNQYANTLTSPPLPQSLTFAGEEVPLDVYWVREALDRELVINCYQHSKTLRILKLSSRVFPTVEKILKEEGVPDDFKYLCVAESGLENVTSPANAGGYWQFIPSTAKVYGLEVGTDVDERCHLEKATRAACKYLKKMKNQFGSWTMAAAGYNRGDGGLQAAVDDQKVHNYWDLWLNSETSRYVYRILSFKLIFENPQAYGVAICPAQMYPPIETKTVKVTTSPAFRRGAPRHLPRAPQPQPVDPQQQAHCRLRQVLRDRPPRASQVPLPRPPQILRQPVFEPRRERVRDSARRLSVWRCLRPRRHTGVSWRFRSPLSRL